MTATVYLHCACKRSLCTKSKLSFRAFPVEKQFSGERADLPEIKSLIPGNICKQGSSSAGRVILLGSTKVTVTSVGHLLWTELEVRPTSLVKHSWRVEKRLSHWWRVADECDVKKWRMDAFPDPQANYKYMQLQVCRVEVVVEPRSTSRWLAELLSGYETGHCGRPRSTGCGLRVLQTGNSCTSSFSLAVFFRKSCSKRPGVEKK